MMTKKQLRRLYNVIFVVIGLAISYPVFISSEAGLESLHDKLMYKQDHGSNEYFREKEILLREGKTAEAEKLSRPRHRRSILMSDMRRNSKELSASVTVAFYVVSYFLVYYVIVMLSKLFKWICRYVKGQPSEGD